MGISSFFTKERNGYNDSSLRLGRVAGTVAAGVLALTTIFRSFYITEQREVTLEIQFGKITEQQNEAGLHLKNPLAGKTDISLARQKTEKIVLENLRLGDDIKLSGEFEVEFEVTKGTDVAKLYNDLVGQGGDLTNVVEIRAKDSAVKALESLSIADLMPSDQDIESALKGNAQKESKGFTEKMGERITERLRDVLKEQGWPVNIMGIYSNGFTFSPESERKIADVVDIRMQKLKLSLRSKNAEDAQKTYAKEAAADAAYVGTLIENGMPQSDAVGALCLKMNRDVGRVNEPFAAGCGLGGSSGSVSVAVMPKAAAAAAAPKAPAPQ